MGILLNRRAIELVAIAGVLAGLGFGNSLPVLPLCPVRVFTEIPCPTCGVTRALFALMHGRVALAAHLNPVVFIVATILLRRVVVLALLQSRVATLLADSRVDRALMIAFFIVGSQHWATQFLGG